MLTTERNWFTLTIAGFTLQLCVAVLYHDPSFKSVVLVGPDLEWGLILCVTCRNEWTSESVSVSGPSGNAPWWLSVSYPQHEPSSLDLLASVHLTSALSLQDSPDFSKDQYWHRGYNIVDHWFSDFSHQVPPHKVSCFPSTMLRIKLMYSIKHITGLTWARTKWGLTQN